MSDRREARLLLAIVREDWDAASDAAREGEIVPERFAGLARACDVAPWIHARLGERGRFDLVGASAERELGALRAKTRNDNLLLLALLEQALDVLRGAGITPVALKGADVLHRFYRSFDERTLDDVDLLVSPGDASRAIEALEAAGWRGPQGAERTHWLRSSFEMPLTSPGPVGVLFEIHWSLGQERRYTVGTERILARAVPLQVAGRAIRRLEDHDAAAHLLLHHVQHYFDRRLKWAIDLKRIVASEGFRWEAVAERLGAWDGRGAAGLALAHLERIDPAIAPADARRLIPAAAWRLAATLPLRSGHPLEFYRGTRKRWVQQWIAAAALERPRDLPGYLLHRARRDADEAVEPRP